MVLPEDKTGGRTEMQIRQVGVVRSPIKEPSLWSQSGDLKSSPEAMKSMDDRQVISELVIDNDLAGILDGIEDFSHILVLYWAHLVSPEARSIIRAHPVGRKDLPLVGIFATCSPARPNTICTMIVRLLEHKGNVLKVQGLDAVDGSPILDIKPYNPGYYAADNVKIADWMQQVFGELDWGPDDRWK